MQSTPMNQGRGLRDEDGELERVGARIGLRGAVSTSAGVEHEASLGPIEEVLAAVRDVRSPICILQEPQGRLRVRKAHEPLPRHWEARGYMPALYPEWLGSRAFLESHGVRFPYVVGEMAQGIATTRMVKAAARAGFLGFFGSAGLPLFAVEEALVELERDLGAQGASFGMNLIHAPHEPVSEELFVDLLLRRGIRRMSASAFMDITKALVRYAAKGLRADAQGYVHRQNFVFAKVSRPEVAAKFLRPAPRELVDALVADRVLTAEEGRLATTIPLASDLTVEADSGGHTDNQALTVIFPILADLRDQGARESFPTAPVRLGAAGGLATPRAVASAFALGAAYVVTGTVNQAAAESGLSPEAQRLLVAAGSGDVTMAPAADMFEMGVRVQVLRRGTLFSARAAKLYELYRGYPSLEALPGAERERLERDVFREPLSKVWSDTRAYFETRAPEEIQKADTDPKHRMALVFRSYLGRASRWAIDGAPDRVLDYQVWCGPAMAAFNAWVRGSFLEPLAQRGVEQIGRNLLEGAAVVTRAHQLRAFGVDVPDRAFQFVPRPLHG